MLADVRKQLQVPQCIVVTAMRPDMVLYTVHECERNVYFSELMTPSEDVTEEALKKEEANVCRTCSESEGMRLASTYKTSGDSH